MERVKISDRPLRIALSAGGRFVAFHQANQLMKRKSLIKFFTASYTKKDEAYIPKNFVYHSSLCQVIDQCYVRLHLQHFINKSNFYVLKDNLFDYQVSRELEKIGSLDLFIGWSHYLLKSIPVVKKHGAKIIVEAGSCHILTQQKILQEEYKKYNIPFVPITPQNREKIIAEYEQVDCIMTPSEFVRNSFLAQGIEQEKVLKVNYGIDVAYFKKSTAGSWIQPSRFIVIFVGMLSIQKGIHYLVEAWNQLNLPENKTQLLLVGSMQKDVDVLLKKMRIKKNVIFYGATTQQNLLSLYQASSLFVLPSLQDGFATVMREAMISGLPIICSNQSGGDDLITHGDNGFVVPAGNSNVLAEKIEWCYHNQEQAHLMGVKAQEKINHYTWDAYGEQVFTFYQKILGKK